MILKDKMFVISELLDESIKAQTTVYDVRLFRTFIDFESFMEGTPIILNTLVVSTRELPFNNTNMMRLVGVLCSPFLTLTGPFIYIIDEENNQETVTKFFEQAGVDNVVVYQGEINTRYVTDIITGKARESNEQKVYSVTYMVRAEEYLKQQSSLSYDALDEKYNTDEDDLSEVPDEEAPEDIRPATLNETQIHYIVGPDREERTTMVFLMAQFLALNGRCIIIEKDDKYHRLSEYFTKSGIEGLFITVNEFYNNIQDVITRIKDVSNKLIVIGCVDRIKYNYQFIFNILYSNLREDVTDMIMECDYHDVPQGVQSTYVCANTIPEIIKMGVSIQKDIDPKNTKFIGLQLNNLNPVNVNTKEMLAVLSVILTKNDLVGQVFRANGITLSGEGACYDIFSILGNKNRR